MWADPRPSKGIVTAQCGAPHETGNLDIEVLRAFAIGGVILHHLPDPLLARQHGLLNWLMQHVDYWTGVDLFFAISGYVIARGTLPALWARNDRSGFVTEAGAFWIRRAFRLLPSSWFWLAMLLLASLFFNELRIGTVPVFGEPVTNIRATLTAVGFYYNVFEAWAFSHGKFAWWSLSLEEQFYFVLPIVAFVLQKRLAIVLVFFALATIGLHGSPLGMMFRTEAIALGVLLIFVELNWRLLETPTRRYGAYLAQTFRNRRDHARQEFSYVPNHT